MNLIKFLFNFYYEKLHRYCFDYCYQSQNADWHAYTPYIKANINNPYRKFNNIIDWFYTAITPMFKGWRKQVKQHKPEDKKYFRYENI